MYERFTDLARKVMQLANQAAIRLNHEYINTEHLLIGLAQLQDYKSGVSNDVFEELGITSQKIQDMVAELVQPGPETVLIGKLPQTLRVKKVLEYAIESAKEMNNNYVGTEHLLLGLLREDEGVAANVLARLGVTKQKVLEAIISCRSKRQEIGTNPEIALLQLRRRLAVQLLDFEGAANIDKQLAQLQNKKSASTHEEKVLWQMSCTLLGYLKGECGASVALQEITKLALQNSQVT